MKPFSLGIRWKIVITSFLCLSAPLYLLNRYTIRTFDHFTRTALEEEMTSHARMAGTLYATLVASPNPPAEMEGRAPRGRPPDLDPGSFPILLRTFSTNASARLQIVDTNGVVRFDGLDDSARGASLAMRPEIQRALAGRYGARSQLTPDRRLMYYYCAVPITRDGRVIGAAAVTRHTGPIAAAIRRIALDQRRALLASLAFAAVISVLLGQTFTRRLRRLTATARDYARGQLPAPRVNLGRDEIAEVERAIDRMAQDLETRHRYNRDFVATTLHELRTPITAIRGAVEVLEAGAMDKPHAREKFLSNLRFEADRLTRLVGELSELTRIDTENLREKRTPTPYGDCVRAIVDRLRPTFATPHAALAVEIPAEPLTASIVPERIEQVLANLIENALRYTPPTGTVTVRVTRPNAREILTTVADTGPGIPAENLERVFDRFYTTEPKGIPRDYGSGLGLAVARSIVEHHGGRIFAANRPTGGASFAFTLPAS